VEGVMLGAASWSPLFEPGFFSSEPVHVALVVGAIAAIVSGTVGVFTVIRGQSFAGHALSDIGTAGGSAAFLVGASTIYGFVAFNVVAAAVMELIGLRKPRGRDLATGIVLGASLGLAALFLYEDTISSSTTGATVNVLFGSIFTLPSGITTVMTVLGVASVALIVVLYRPRGARRAGPPGRRRLPPGPRVGGLDVRGHDRRDPLDGPVDRTGCRRPSVGDPHRGRHPYRRRGRRVCLLGRHVDRLRQHRMGWRERVAGQLLHRGRLRTDRRRVATRDRPKAPTPVEVA
jgi:hypothetical protein